MGGDLNLKIKEVRMLLTTTWVQATSSIAGLVAEDIYATTTGELRIKL